MDLDVVPRRVIHALDFDIANYALFVIELCYIALCFELIQT